MKNIGIFICLILCVLSRSQAFAASNEKHGVHEAPGLYVLLEAIEFQAIKDQPSLTLLSHCVPYDTAAQRALISEEDLAKIFKLHGNIALRRFMRDQDISHMNFQEKSDHKALSKASDSMQRDYPSCSIQESIRIAIAQNDADAAK